MKYLTLLMIVCAISQVKGIANPYLKHKIIQAEKTDTTLEGEWHLQPVLASDTAAGKIPKINFDVAKHHFTGNTGCNNMGGNFFVNADSLSFDQQIIMTKMACEGYNEKLFIESLGKVNRYKIVGGVLQLMNDQTILSKWVRKVNIPKTQKA